MGKSKEVKEVPEFGTVVQFLSSEYDNVLSEVLAKYVSKKGGTRKQTFSKQGAVTNNKTVSGNTSDSGKSVNKTTGEVDLPGAEVGRVCLRFTPEPSGYLHIGHSKAALLNQYFAQRYQGKVILCFDDTNPAKESNGFVDNIIKDVETLGINYEKLTYTSDYFPQMMEMAENLIKQGKAYVDDTPREQMHKERMDGIESKCRSNSIEENMRLWKEMVAGSDRGLQCCLLVKRNMQDPIKSVRDPVYYRCHPVPHH
ncbi:hypothetical protein SAY86_027463 [Trapa natans]|uniref:Glutamyl/glutaminyl-tRNA synthetase class Ib catalytic domain-containing protein n=1 Tax=Trapa natans TaxID=22666 RepID=A0AAN7KRF9_TRANT|nr:hypothetical protein SAY86_027463 [Trapa natans]